MNRGAIGYVVRLIGVESPAFIAKIFVEESPEGTILLIDDSSGGRKYPRDGMGSVSETDDGMIVMYGSGGHFGESGVEIKPVNVDRWNSLASQRPEMATVADFGELESMMRW